jgi:hypothetical protein
MMNKRDHCDANAVGDEAGATRLVCINFMFFPFRGTGGGLRISVRPVGDRLQLLPCAAALHLFQSRLSELRV